MVIFTDRCISVRHKCRAMDWTDEKVLRFPSPEAELAGLGGRTTRPAGRLSAWEEHKLAAAKKFGRTTRAIRFPLGEYEPKSWKIPGQPRSRISIKGPARLEL